MIDYNLIIAGLITSFVGYLMIKYIIFPIIVLSWIKELLK